MPCRTTAPAIVTAWRKRSPSIYKEGTNEEATGTFVCSVYDLNVNRTGQSPKNIFQAASHNWFSEQVRIDDIASRDVYYINDSYQKLTVNGNIIMPSGSGGGNSYETGFATQAQSGFSFVGYNAGGPAWQTEFYIMPRSGITHGITSYSGYGGSIKTTTTGAIGFGTELDGGKIDSPRTYDVPAGKNVSYVMAPDSEGFEVNQIYIDNSPALESDGSIKAAYASTLTESGGTYTFNNVATTHKISVSWKPTTTPPVSVAAKHLGAEPGHTSSVDFVELKKDEVTVEPSTATVLDTIPLNYNEPKKLGQDTVPPTSLTKDEKTYQFSFFGLGQADALDTGMGYGASVDMWLWYTEYGTYEYSVHGTHWETWGYGTGNKPTVYLVYTYAGSTKTHYYIL